MCTKQLSRTLLLSSLAGVAIGPAFAAQTATTFPSHPVRLIIPYTPGGATDSAPDRWRRSFANGGVNP